MLPSSQAVPSGFSGVEQMPVLGSQTPSAWHWSGAAHATGRVPTHAPLWQVSVCVQGLPSLQAVPSSLAGFVHAPVFGSQVPASWH